MLKFQTVISQSERQTQALAAELLQKYLPAVTKTPLIFALEGELGSGKTVFVKGLAKALGIKKLVRSPSYTLVHEYEFSLPQGQTYPQGQTLETLRGRLIHVDLWRVEGEKEFLALGVEPDIKPGNIIAIEWAEKVADYLRRLDRVVWVKFEHQDRDKRGIRISNGI